MISIIIIKHHILKHHIPELRKTLQRNSGVSFAPHEHLESHGGSPPTPATREQYVYVYVHVCIV